MGRELTLIPTGKTRTPVKPASKGAVLLKRKEVDRLAKSLGLATINTADLTSYAKLGEHLAEIGAVQVGRGLYVAALATSQSLMKTVQRVIEEAEGGGDLAPLIKLGLELNEQQITVGSNLIRSAQLIPDLPTDQPGHQYQLPPPGTTFINAPGAVFNEQPTTKP